jgi:hypothetical protein
MAFLEALGGGAIGAVATVCAQGFAKWRTRPRLRVEYVHEDDLAPPFSESDQKSDARARYLFVRPRVCGENGKRSAHRVQVILNGCNRLDAKEQPQHANLLLGRPLKWSDVDSNELDVPPGICRRFDLVHVRHRSSDPVDEPLQVTLDIYPTPREDRHRLPAGEYELELALVAQDLPSQFFRFVVAVAEAMPNELRADMLTVSLHRLSARPRLAKGPRPGPATSATR